MEDTELPEALVLHILFFLPPRDAARTSILSKTWRRFWNSLPTENFRFNYSSKRKDSEAVKRMDKFIKSIDDSLQRLQGRMAKIGTFCLFLGCYQQKLPSYMNDWIGLVANNCIQELHIGVCFISAEDIRRSVLPQATFLAKPLIGLVDLSIPNLLRLKKVIVDELDFIDIGAFNLEILHCEKLSYELELSLLVCNNLKKLRLSSPITNQWIQEPFDKFQSLEILHLEFIKRFLNPLVVPLEEFHQKGMKFNNVLVAIACVGGIS
ncbi:putative FBD-associated F-box protein At5g56700 [Hevea brasiliensis]|uniref:putative FBD-associated F-box protein At5g56700 n=1 Tax=Hevea brasiliensis TaxID=3981 RepID=UPI0025E52B61|nr:putative FBD-associated F-box protein At5g56700 [Hevea brasiliensis]